MDEVSEWLNKAAAGSKASIESSDIFSGIVTKNFLESPLCALQIGYAILMNKPIILLVDKDVEIPESLVKAAKAIQRIDTTKPNWTKAAADAVGEFAKGLK